MRWHNFEAVRNVLAETARVADTYITLTHLQPGGRETQLGSHPWDDMHEVQPWLYATAQKLDPGPEGVKVRTRVLKKGGTPLKSVVSLVTGKGRGPQPDPAPTAARALGPTPPPPPPQAPPAPAMCPTCAATQAILATRQLQVVDLEARLERARDTRRDLEARLARLQVELEHAHGTIAAMEVQNATLRKDMVEIQALARTFIRAADAA